MNREKSGRSERRLSRNERELWASVTRAVAPLRAAGPPTQPEKFSEPPEPPHAAPAASPKPHEKPVPPLAGLDRRLRQRLVRGRAELDGRIDLHGLTQAKAHDALVHFLRARRSDGARVVLVITGKGAGGVGADRGVLRRQVPQWLRSPQLREAVLGFEPAAPAHGGEGAFYVRLRRARGRMS